MDFSSFERYQVVSAPVSIESENGTRSSGSSTGYAVILYPDDYEETGMVGFLMAYNDDMESIKPTRTSAGQTRGSDSPDYYQFGNVYVAGYVYWNVYNASNDVVNYYIPYRVEAKWTSTDGSVVSTLVALYNSTGIRYAYPTPGTTNLGEVTYRAAYLYQTSPVKAQRYSAYGTSNYCQDANGQFVMRYDGSANPEFGSSLTIGVKVNGTTYTQSCGVGPSA